MVLLDFIVIGVGYYRPLLPIFAKDILFVGPAGFGMLSSAPAIGGMIGTVTSAAVRRCQEQGHARTLVVSRLRDGPWRFRAIDELLAVVRSARRHGLGQFAASGHAPDHLSSANAGASARPRLLRVSICFPKAPTASAPPKSASWPRSSARPARCSSAAPSAGLLTLGCWMGMPNLRKFGAG